MKTFFKILIIYLIFNIFYTAYFRWNQKGKYGLSEFQAERYLGEWYEVVRKDHGFERGLINVTARYEDMGNGKIKVINSGYDLKNKKIKTAKGMARVKYKNFQNILKVSFFRPFYSDYIVMDYDREEYSYALVRGKSDKYLWILSRKANLDSEIVEKLLEEAKKDGIEVDDVIYVTHGKSE